MTSENSLAERFLADFKFGVATAAYQIEGAIAEDGRKPSIWDAFSHMPGRVLGGHTGDIACNHYHLWEQDLDVIASLQADAYRFSIAWPRVIPDGRGAVNQKGLDFYDRLVDGLVARGIGVFPTLYHWDLPLTLQGYGGWTNRDTAEVFAEYTRVVVGRIGDRVDALATFNEPWCSCYHGHLNGEHAPGEQNLDAALAAVHVTNLAHGLGVQAARSVRSDIPMGIVLNAVSIYPASNHPEDLAAAERAFQFHNGVFFSPIFNGQYDDEFLAALGDRLPLQDNDLETIHQPIDWWGFNYYLPVKLANDPTPGATFPATISVPATDSDKRTDIDWEIDAKGLSHLLRQVYGRYELPPCYITENGACYNVEVVDGAVDDQPRLDYLNDHITDVAGAIESGIPVHGYFAWSLMDNFEWAEGYNMRFGIVHVNYDTQIRTIKKSGHWYKALAAAHGRLPDRQTTAAE